MYLCFQEECNDSEGVCSYWEMASKLPYLCSRTITSSCPGSQSILRATAFLLFSNAPAARCVIPAGTLGAGDERSVLSQPGLWSLWSYSSITVKFWVPFRRANGEADLQSLNFHGRVWGHEKATEGQGATSGTTPRWLRDFAWAVSTSESQLPHLSNGYNIALPASWLVCCQIDRDEICESGHVYTLQKKLFEWIEKEDALFTILTFVPWALCLPPGTLPATPWTLKAGGLKMTEVIFFQAVKAIKSQAVEWNAQIATGYAETALFSGWGSARAYLLAFSIYKGKLQVIILNGFVCPVGG